VHYIIFNEYHQFIYNNFNYTKYVTTIFDDNMSITSVTTICYLPVLIVVRHFYLFIMFFFVTAQLGLSTVSMHVGILIFYSTIFMFCFCYSLIYCITVLYFSTCVVVQLHTEIHQYYSL